jgi:kynurenine 3-monooxygenase
LRSDSSQAITIAGAGLAGALLATLLARAGWSVEVFEKRSDPRTVGYEGGRSINLALAERGLHALRQAGLHEAVLAQAVMMRGRMVHFLDGHTDLQRYGKDDSEVIWSVHRGRLNLLLLDAAEAAGARLHFDTKLDAVDFDAKTMRLASDRASGTREYAFDVLVGADGAGSALRGAINAVANLGERFESLGHGYKELEIPPASDGEFGIEPNALHIWPRGRYMCIALPNTERTFTVTLFLPTHAADGAPGFDALPDAQAARAMFARDFADALPLIPDFDADWSGNPIGMLSTLYLDRWHLDGRAVLLGDAAHAMVPFHGQGMNCAFEDCVALARHIADGDDFTSAFAAFEADRLPNARAIQQMALENYLEMRDRVDDADFLLQRELERLLATRHPDRFVPRYAMVTFRRIPYATALERGRIQRELLVEATRGVTRIEDVDLATLDRKIASCLSPLSEAPGASFGRVLLSHNMFAGWDAIPAFAPRREIAGIASRPPVLQRLTDGRFVLLVRPGNLRQRSAPHPHRAVRRAAHRRKPRSRRRTAGAVLQTRRRSVALAGSDPDHWHHAAARAARWRQRSRIDRTRARRIRATANVRGGLQLAALRRRIHPLRAVPQLP